MGLDCWRSSGLGETETPLMEGAQKGTEGKSRDFVGAWDRPPSCCWRVSWGRRKWCGSPWGHKSWQLTYQGVFTGMWTLTGGKHLALDLGTNAWPHPTTYKLQCWDTLPNNREGGTQSHSSKDRLPKHFLSPQPPWDTPCDTAWPTREPATILPTSGQTLVPPTGSLHKPVDQSQQPEG